MQNSEKCYSRVLESSSLWASKHVFSGALTLQECPILHVGDGLQPHPYTRLTYSLQITTFTSSPRNQLIFKSHPQMHRIKSKPGNCNRSWEYFFSRHPYLADLCPTIKAEITLLSVHRSAHPDHTSPWMLLWYAYMANSGQGSNKTQLTHLLVGAF